jgi:hypothetical protein
MSGAGARDARAGMRLLSIDIVDASRGAKLRSRISRRDSRKKPVLASGDETRSR